MKLNDLVTLERGHLSWFRYPTHNIGTYLGRGEAVEHLGIEFSRCGADVTQTYTYQAPQLQGSDCFPPGTSVTSEEVNAAACAISSRVRAKRGCLVAGGLTTTGLYKPGRNCKYEVQEIFKKNLDILVSGGVDFIILEFFRSVTELEWALEVSFF